MHQRGIGDVEVEIARVIAGDVGIRGGDVAGAKEVGQTGPSGGTGEEVGEPVAQNHRAQIQLAGSEGGVLPTRQRHGPEISVDRIVDARVAPAEHGHRFARPVLRQPREGALNQRRAQACGAHRLVALCGFTDVCRQCRLTRTAMVEEREVGRRGRVHPGQLFQRCDLHAVSFGRSGLGDPRGERVRRLVLRGRQAVEARHDEERRAKRPRVVFAPQHRRHCRAHELGTQPLQRQILQSRLELACRPQSHHQPMRLAVPAGVNQHRVVGGQRSRRHGRAGVSGCQPTLELVAHRCLLRLAADCGLHCHDVAHTT